MRIAVFDIGTNSIHMLVVDARKNGRFEVLEHEKDVTRLGDGSFRTKRLTKPSITRALGVIRRFYQVAKKYKAKTMIGVATSAVRDAKNGGQFLKEVSRTTGLKIPMISGEEEARLIFLGAHSTLGKPNKKSVVIDVGGGSAEFILGNARGTYFLESFPLGAARLTDQFIRHDPPLGRELKALERFIGQKVAKTVGTAKRIGYDRVVGTAGAMINLASMVHEAREGKPLKIKDHTLLKIKDLKEIHKMLIKMSLRERLRLPGLDPKRADIMIAGSVLVNTLARLLGVKEFIISKRGIRQGMVLDFIDKHRKML